MTENKIPKLIHYCWFGDDDIPLFLQGCIKSWKEVMPDYELKLWNSESFNFDSVPFVKEAFRAKKWAFVADYIRLFALYKEGGIYLDTDVRVFKKFDKYLKYNFFTSHELHPGNFTEFEQNKLNKNYLPHNKAEYVYGLNILAAIMGSVKGNPYIKDCLEFYHDKNFLGKDGELLCEDLIIGPYISKKAEKFGYTYHAVEQLLDGNMIILKPEVFVGNSVYLTKNSYAIHLCNGSWKDKTYFEEIAYNIRNNYPALYPVVVFGRRTVRNIKRLFSSIK